MLCVFIRADLAEQFLPRRNVLESAQLPFNLRFQKYAEDLPPILAFNFPSSSPATFFWQVQEYRDNMASSSRGPASDASGSRGGYPRQGEKQAWI